MHDSLTFAKVDLGNTRGKLPPTVYNFKILISKVFNIYNEFSPPSSNMRLPKHKLLLNEGKSFPTKTMTRHAVSTYP